ncbi:MAG TPA: ABC transporter ATP-binding protein [Ilumatobacteraceae bacterium]|nr:ABC transporter ATP-binding protein [Ilumatobacteraceae bacterium]
MTSSSLAPALLEVDDLVVTFRGAGRVGYAVSSVSFRVDVGETVAIVGESGSGKTVTILSILGLVPSPPAHIASGTARFLGVDLLSADQEQLRAIRGKDVGVVFQDPMTSLNPVITVGEQIREAIWVHDRHGSRAAHMTRVEELLALVGIPQPAERAKQYPHEFSGGMRQRAMIAMAIANRPKLLIADEPTTALDVTIQAQVIDVLMEAKRSSGAATIIVSHDLGLVAEIADRVIVMYAGRIVEEATADDLFDQPRHPYTVGLLASLPSLDQRRERLPSIPGQPPQITEKIVGCPFRTRCGLGHDRERCATEQPPLIEVVSGHRAACHYVDEVADWAQRASQVDTTDGRETER